MSQNSCSNKQRRTRMDAGHSNINQKKLAEYRRDQVFRLSSMGYSQPKIANVLNVSQSLISLDISLLRQKAREALADYLENKLPLIFQESMAGISDVISQTWDIINNPDVSQHHKLHALSLVADCNERRLDMASNGSIVEDGIRFMQEARQRLITIAPETAKEMLYGDEDKDSEVNVNVAYDDDVKEVMKKEEQGEQIGGEEGEENNNRGKNKNNSSSNNGSDGGSSISDSCSDHKQQTGFAADDTTDKLQQQYNNNNDSSSKGEGLSNKKRKQPRNSVF